LLNGVSIFFIVFGNGSLKEPLLNGCADFLYNFFKLYLVSFDHITVGGARILDRGTDTEGVRHLLQRKKILWGLYKFLTKLYIFFGRF
jgi:hypothetical protein